jgi:hypothetical protein
VHYSYFAGMVNCSHEFVIKKLKSRSSIPQNPERSTAVFIKIKHLFRDVQKGKIGYSSAPLSPLSNASRINILGDLCEKLQPNLSASHILKSAWDSLHQQSKKGVISCSESDRDE